MDSVLDLSGSTFIRILMKPNGLCYWGWLLLLPLYNSDSELYIYCVTIEMVYTNLRVQNLYFFSLA